MAQVRRIADRYEVSPLEGGGMGVIWRGHDTVLDRLVAIKQIRTDEFDTPALREDLVERFRREARITAKIEHPGVPAVYDAAIDRDPGDPNNVDKLYLVMQLIRGVTVADLLAEHGPLPVSWAVAVAAQVCSVLAYAHAVPVVHRDLKPSNVMLDESGAVKVLDFGVAAVLGTDITRLTETGRVIGSRDYMAPEQFHGVGVSPRSDLYALGCLLHEMLTATKVFDSSRDPALQHVHDAPTPLRSLRSDVDEAIERLVLDLLAKSPDDRPATAEDVYGRLIPFLPRHGDPAPSGGTGHLPDPTGPYRQPLAPRTPRISGPASIQSPPYPLATPIPDVVPGPLARDLDVAEQQTADLIDEDRYSQAVSVLDDALAKGTAQIPADHPRLLALRNTRAATLFLGGDYREALAAFTELALAYSRTAGPGDPRVIDCRKQAAYCHAELGDHEAALADFAALLQQQRRDRGERSAEALELRHQVGILLLAANRLHDAVQVLRPLYDDYLAVRAARDPETVEVKELLTRIELAVGAQPESAL